MIIVCGKASMNEKESLTAIFAAVCALAEKLTGQRLEVRIMEGDSHVWIGSTALNYWGDLHDVSDANEILITPAMIEAGEFAVHEGLSGAPELPAFFDAALFAKKVFLVMEAAR
jgi:hypothetical protein